MGNMDKIIVETVRDAIITVPGVAAFANYKALNPKDISTLDITNVIEFEESDDISKFKIHIVALQGVNIKDVAQEIQIRVKYELEKHAQFAINYLVDVIIEDVL